MSLLTSIWAKNMLRWNPNPIAQWEYGDRVYIVICNPGENYPYSLRYAGKDCGGSSPFSTLDELEIYLAKRFPNMKRHKDKQLALEL